MRNPNKLAIKFAPIALVASSLGLSACSGSEQPAVVCSTDHLKPHTVDAGETYWKYAREMDPDQKIASRGDLALAIRDANNATSYTIEAGMTVMLPPAKDCHAS